LFFCSLAFGQTNALKITQPATSNGRTIVTTDPAISFEGTLAWSGGDRRVLWESNRGFSDLAAVSLADDGKTILWSSNTQVPLRPGINHVRIKALGQPGAAASVNIFYTPQTQEPVSELRTTILHGQSVTYEVRDGLAIYQSDIVLGKAADVAAAAAHGPTVASAHSVKGAHPDSLTITPNFSSSTGLWPVVNGIVRVPYTNPSGINATNVNAAIAESNTQLAGIVQWVPALASDFNLVQFDFAAGGNGSCEALAGMQGGGPQYIGGSGNCTTTTILHEMGHALGLYHEQSRGDRNSYVNFMEQNVDKPNIGNFDLSVPTVESGLYNYASIMEYGPFGFNKDGVSLTLETLPAGMVLGTPLPQYTTGDLDGIMRLYAHAPASVTVDTNPTGLQVIADGTTCTAPCVFTSWTMGSQHTLSVPLNGSSQTLQTLSGDNYIFGRWNSVLTAGTIPANGGCPSTGCSAVVTNSAGNGTLLSPTTSPAITNYLASFIPVHPYSPAVSPSGDATITPSPAPSASLTINGAPTYLDRQLVTLTVTPKPGFSFYDWFPSPFFNIYLNPASVYLTDDLNTVTAGLVSDAVTTVTAASPDVSAQGIFPGFAIGVTDGNGNYSTVETPANFDASVNGSGFASGKTVSFYGAMTQSPVTTNISYAFNNWTGGGTPSGNNLSVIVGASGQAAYTANYSPSFRSIVEPSLYCEPTFGNNELGVTATPAGTNSIGTDGNLDAFFSDGTVTFTALTSTSAGNSGLSFVGWSQDLSGVTNPLPYSLTGQTLGTANFNVAGSAPMTVTGISPAAPTVTTSPVNLTINGTGFSTSSLYTYYVNPVTGYFFYRNNTSATSTQVVIELCGAGAGCAGGEPSTYGGDIPTAGYYQVAVLNAVPSGCNPSIIYTFPVANSAGPPVLSITKSHAGNFSPGQQNATYTVSVSNTGTGSTVDPVTVTENVPSGETLVSMAGSGWTCSANTCTRSDTLNAGLSYGAITVTVDVAANATSPQVNSVTVSGGGAGSATATDSTTIISMVPVPNVVGDTQAAASTAITGAGLVVGSVTTASSSTVASGDVISESPAAGTSVVTGSAVNLVVSVGPPTVVSLSPDTGMGLMQTFTAVYSDPDGESDLSSVTVLFNTSAKLSGACAVVYTPPTNKMYLYNNTGTAVLTPAVVPGSSTSLSNSQCTLTGTGSSFSKSGNNLTLNAVLTFTSTFLGQKNVYLLASSKTGSSGYVLKGTWTPSSAGPPTVVSLSPTSGSGLNKTFTAVFSDPNGVPDLKSVSILLNTSVKLSSGCFVIYEPASNKMYLYNNAGTALLSPGVTPGSSGSVSNSQCTVLGTGSSFSILGNDLTLSVALGFTSTFTGKQNVYLAATGETAKSGYLEKGTWTP
jgi:hypothetical protein